MLANTSPTRALAVQSIHQFQAARLQRARDRAVTTSAEQQAKALDLQALTRSEGQLRELERAHGQRMTALDGELDAAKADTYKLLGSYYLVQALVAERAPDRSAWLDQAERYAKAAGHKALIEEIRKAKEKKE